MSSFAQELWRENPRARKATSDQLVRAFKERVRAANRMGATSMRLTECGMHPEVQNFIEQEGFRLIDEITIGCGRNIFDARDPDCRCCERCSKRVRVTHKRVIWKEE